MLRDYFQNVSIKYDNMLYYEIGGPCGREVKIADFSALDSIISSLWVLSIF